LLREFALCQFAGCFRCADGHGDQYANGDADGNTDWYADQHGDRYAARPGRERDEWRSWR
jgi:hypothetical protein